MNGIKDIEHSTYFILHFEENKKVDASTVLIFRSFQFLYYHTAEMLPFSVSI